MQGLWSGGESKRFVLKTFMCRKTGLRTVVLIGVAVLTVFGFLASETLNANDFLLNGTGRRRPLLRQNQSGLGISGPIKELFFSYQGIHQLNGIAAGRSKTAWYIVGGLSLIFAEALL